MDIRKEALVFVLLVLMGTSCAPSVQRAGSEGPLTTKVDPESIVRVQMRIGSKRKEGDGYFISQNGCVITSDHVVLEAARGNPRAEVFIHRGGALERVRLVGISVADDVAVFKAGDSPQYIHLPAHSQELSPQEKVYPLFRDILGDLREVTLTFEGVEFLWYKNITVYAFRFRETLAPGYSGTVVVRKDGVPIGHVAAIYKDRRGGTLVIPHSRYLFTILIPDIIEVCGINPPELIKLYDNPLLEYFDFRK